MSGVSSDPSPASDRSPDGDGGLLVLAGDRLWFASAATTGEDGTGEDGTGDDGGAPVLTPLPAAPAAGDTGGETALAAILPPADPATDSARRWDRVPCALYRTLADPPPDPPVGVRAVPLAEVIGGLHPVRPADLPERLAAWVNAL